MSKFLKKYWWTLLVGAAVTLGVIYWKDIKAMYSKGNKSTPKDTPAGPAPKGLVQASNGNLAIVG